MVKYKIEGDIDFYKELKEIDDKEDSQKDEDNICLISNEELTSNFVKLKCGHKFNYLPLYKDIINHKNKFNSMEMTSSTVRKEQIRCPYCRSIHNNLLPYVEMEGVEKKHGINFFDENFEKYTHKFIGECCYESINHLYDDTKEEEFITNPKMIKCNTTEVIKIKENGKDYCSYHKSLIQKEFLKEKIKKEKDALKESKLLAKIKEKKEKIMEKEKVNIEKKKLILENANEKKTKKVTKINLEENVIVTVFCNAILKTGKNIGCQCSNKVIENDKCKRHLNINTSKI